MNPSTNRRRIGADEDDAPGLWVVALVIFGLAGIGGPLLAILVFLILRNYI